MRAAHRYDRVVEGALTGSALGAALPEHPHPPIRRKRYKGENKCTRCPEGPGLSENI